MRIDARGVDGRHQPEQEARPDRERERERDQSPIGVDLDGARQVRWQQREQWAAGESQE